MTGSSALVFVVSALLLLHSAYSAYEFAQYRKYLPVSAASGQSLVVPLDIKIEACAGVALACLAAVVSVLGTLKPIKFSKSVAELEAKGQNPFGFLDQRPGFQNIVAKREGFSKWAKEKKV